MSTKLESLLEDRAISQKELAEMVGKSYQTVNNFVTGRTDASEETLKKIAEYLKISPKEIKVMAREEANARPVEGGPDVLREVEVKYVVDPEVQAIGGILKYMDGLSPAAQMRVMEYVMKKLEAQKGETKYPKGEE